MATFPTTDSNIISNEFSFGLPPLVPTRTKSTASTPNTSNSKWILNSSTFNVNFTSWSRVYENTGVDAVDVAVDDAVGKSSNNPTTGQTTGQTTGTIPSASASASASASSNNQASRSSHQLLLPPLMTSVIAYSDDDYELFLKSKFFC